jgi:DNA-binding NarL/FixJ family response regulator
MLAIAICCADAALRDRLEHMLRTDRCIAFAGAFADPSAILELAAQRRVDVVLVDRPSLKQLAGRFEVIQTRFLVLLDGENEESRLDLLGPVRAVLPRTAHREELLAAIKAVVRDYVVLPRKLLVTLLDAESPPAALLDHGCAERASLTPRELEVLAAMADGASNKAIARRLGISFHTAKFHVAAILAKLDADSRTEAVAKAAQSGLVML